MSFQTQNVLSTLLLLLLFSISQSAAVQCDLGYYCPTYYSDPVPCDASQGNYCPVANLTAPMSCYATNQLQDSTYCPYWWVIETCPAGYSCSSNSGPNECSPGSYATAGSWSCKHCFSLFLTSGSGAAKCNVPTIPFIFLLCAASVACMVGSCGLFWICRACHAGVTSQTVHVAHAGTRNEVTQAAAAEAARVKAEQEAADRVRCDQERPRIKREVMERLMRELRVDLEMRFPQALQIFPAVIPGSGATISADMPPELQRLIQGLGVVPFHSQSPLQSYEQFVSDSLYMQLDTALISQALDALILQSQIYNQIEFHQAIMGIRPMILESFPMFTAMERGEVIASKMNFHVANVPVGVGEQLAAKENIQQRWAQELQQYVQAWMQRSNINVRPPPQTAPTVFTQPLLAMPVGIPSVAAYQLPNSVPQFNVPVRS